MALEGSTMTKGLVLAGGTGSRLYPVSRVVNKHLIPIGRQPMIYYPVKTMVESGITEIMVATGPRSVGPIAELLGSGREFGCNFYYRVQENPNGISDAIRLAQDFTSQERLMVMLGDNLVSETFTDIVKDFEQSSSGCRIFLKEMQNVEGLGVARVENGEVTGVVEKPEEFVSNLAVTGIYLFDNRCFQLIETLYPSTRNELEITDLINAYFDLGACDPGILSGDWMDAGTFESLQRAEIVFGSD
jgi:glucose-1-phosphate thymidylyltransferase